MINKALEVFNSYYDLSATIQEIDKGEYLFISGDTMKGFKCEGELAHFLMCRTTHYHFVPKRNEGYKVFNLAFMLVNDNVPKGSFICFNQTLNGSLTLWCLKGGKWRIVTTFADKLEMYYNLLYSRGVFSIIRNVEKQDNKSLWQSISERLFK